MVLAQAGGWDLVQREGNEGMMYRRVEFEDLETTPVQAVCVHPIRWQRVAHGQPDFGVIEAECPDREQLRATMDSRCQKLETALTLARAVLSLCTDESRLWAASEDLMGRYTEALEALDGCDQAVNEP